MRTSAYVAGALYRPMIHTRDVDTDTTVVTASQLRLPEIVKISIHTLGTHRTPEIIQQHFDFAAARHEWQKHNDINLHSIGSLRTFKGFIAEQKQFR